MQINLYFLVLIFFGCPLLVFSGSGNINTNLLTNTVKIKTGELTKYFSVSDGINKDSLPPVLSVFLLKEIPVSILTVPAVASYQAIGIDTVIYLYSKTNAGSGNLPVQELYSGKKLKVTFYQDKIAGKLTLQSDEPMQRIIIFNDKAEEVYSTVSKNHYHTISLNTYKKGSYSILITGARSRSVQFFFQKTE